MQKLGSRRQSRNTAVPLLTLSLEHDLDPEFLQILIEPSPVPIFTTVNVTSLKFESTRLIRLGRHQKILKILVRLFNLLFKGRHEPHPGLDPRRDLLVLQLEQQPQLSRQRVPRLGDFVTWSTNLDHIFLHLHAHGPRHNAILRFPFLLFPRGAAREVGLVLAALGVREVGAVVLVDGQAESALEAAHVVLEEIRVLVEVDRFQGQFPESLSSVCIGYGLRCDTAATELGACAVL